MIISSVMKIIMFLLILAFILGVAGFIRHMGIDFALGGLFVYVLFVIWHKHRYGFYPMDESSGH